MLAILARARGGIFRQFSVGASVGYSDGAPLNKLLPVTYVMTKGKMNARKHTNEKRQAPRPSIRPLACAFGLHDVMMSSGSEKELGSARRQNSRHSIVHIDMPRRLKKSLTVTDDNDTVFKFRKPARRHRGEKRGAFPTNKETSTRTFQTGSVSSSSSSGTIGTRAFYRLPSPRGLSKKLSSRKKKSSTKESRDDLIVARASSSSSLWTDSSAGNEASRDTSVDDETEVRDKYGISESYEDIFPMSVNIQDCYEERDALVLQLNIPTLQTHQPVESLDVEYLPFKIPTLQT